MAKIEKITDDLTGEEIRYPFISIRSARVELSPTRYVWMGEGDVLVFGNGANLGTWAEERLADIIDRSDERDY